MSRLLTITLLCFCTLFLNAQPQTNNWYFGSYNGLNFSTGNPVLVSGGQMGAREGSSVISDASGNLLFYTDGRTVWNRSHAAIGTGLAGGYGSSTQACVIVPKTADGTQYYIFTADEEGYSRGLQYSVVDLTLNGGSGAVTTLNTQLVATTSEKVTAVRHCNKKDYWIITHKYGSDAYYAFLATESGVNPVPVISHGGVFVAVTYATMAGAIKASPDGKKLIANHATIGAELSDFNNQTGVVSNSQEILGNQNGIHYGAEFSANSSRLYISVSNLFDNADNLRYNSIFQFDLSSPLITDIRNSKICLFRYSGSGEMGSLQRALNGKIYLARYDFSKLSVINDPNIAGIGCNFVDAGIVLPRLCGAALPNFLNDYDANPDDFTIGAGGTCINDPVTFNYNFATGVSSVKWDFGDPGSGPQNSSTLANPTHTYISPGPYHVTLVKYSPCGNDTLRKDIIIGDLKASLGTDQGFCAGGSILLDPQSGGTNTYLWQDGSTSPTFSAAQSGLYWVQVSSTTNGCVRRDSVNLTLKPLPYVSLGKDTIVCAANTIQLVAQSDGTSFLWNDNSTLPTLQVSQAGLYWVEAALNGCKSRDTVLVAARTSPRFSLGPDQYVCPGLRAELIPSSTADSYLWQDGSMNLTYTASAEGLYYVDLTNSCGTTRDSIKILKGNCIVYVPSGFTPNSNGRNDLFRASGTGLVDKFDMKIFDRAGHMVFDTQSKTDGWDGRYKGIALPSNVYVYMIRYTEINDPNPKLLKGTILLIR